jgi:hypothetical protein
MRKQRAGQYGLKWMPSAFKLLHLNCNAIMQNVHLKSIWPEEQARKKERKKQTNKQTIKRYYLQLCTILSRAKKKIYFPS